MDSENSPAQLWITKTRSAKPSIHHLLLPEELIEEILAILTVRSLLRFRCVSKVWLSLIDSRSFIKKHLRNSTPTTRLIFNHYKSDGIKQCTLRSFSKDPDLDPSPIVDPSNEHLTTAGTTVIGSWNGLLCILKQKSFFLWNPTTRFSVKLPEIDVQVTKYGFGWDEQTDAYKVFAVVVASDHPDKLSGRVYSSKTNSWKTVEHGCLSLYDKIGVFACGKIHWLTQCGRHVESFDLKSEVFGTTEQPCKPDDGRRWLKEKCGYLIMYCDNNETQFDVWVMEKECWVKKNSAPIPLALRNNNSSYIAIRNRNDGGMKFVPVKKDDNFVVNYYIESLVTPVDTSRQEIEHEHEQIRSISIAEEAPDQDKASSSEQQGVLLK